MIKKLCNCVTDFGKGIIVGFLLAAIIFGIILGVMAHRNRVKEITEYAERQEIIEEMREDYITRDAVEFLEDPGVRRAADDAVDDFQRRIDEVLHRFRNRIAD